MPSYKNTAMKEIHYLAFVVSALLKDSKSVSRKPSLATFCHRMGYYDSVGDRGYLEKLLWSVLGDLDFRAQVPGLQPAVRSRQSVAALSALERYDVNLTRKHLEEIAYAIHSFKNSLVQELVDDYESPQLDKPNLAYSFDTVTVPKHVLYAMAKRLQFEPGKVAQELERLSK